MTRSLAALLLGLAILASDCGAEAADGAPSLSLPLACEPGKTCFIQSFVDIDPGPGILDFACGSATYDGHKGTDFRVLSTAAAGVPVLAAAPGTVKGVRDGMPDMLLRDASPAAVKDRECGNGVVIDHGAGWETQYCHLQKGSLTVKSGDQVERGAALGKVGYSGMADFAHVHLEVRRDGKPIEPFSGLEQKAACLKGRASAEGLWDADAGKAFSYRPGELIGAGFTSAVPDHDKLERDDKLPPIEKNAPQLVFYARFINLKAGDEIALRISGPKGYFAENVLKPLDRNKATFTAYAGKKLTSEAWPPGPYRGIATVRRGADLVLTREVAAEIAP